MWRSALALLALLALASAANAGQWDRVARVAANALGGVDEVEAAAEAADAAAGGARAQAAAPQKAGRRCKSGLGVIIQTPIQAKDLPVTRPPDWDYCTWECAENTTITTNPQTDEIYIQVVHKPIANVTPTMIEWWFRGNVEGDMVHPVDGKTYPRYHVWHPRDHLYQITKRKSPDATTKPGSVDGAVWRITEFIMASQRYNKSDPNCIWSDELYANDDLQVVRLDSAGLRMQLWIGLKNKPMRMQHSWTGSPEGLRLVSTLRIGFQVQGNNSPATVKRYNDRYPRKAFGGNDPEGSAKLWQEHCLQEFSNLKHFLPQLYQQVTGKR